MRRDDVGKTLTRLGLRITELRELRRLTQEELAELLGWSPRQQQRVEAGAANVSVLTLVNIAGALRCSVADLFAKPRRTKRPPGRPKVWT